MNIYTYINYSDEGSTSLQFAFFSKDKSQLQEDKFREVIFEVITNNDVFEWFDLSNQFWNKFNVREYIRYIEYIDYIEYFESKNCNKKQKGIKNSEKRMNLESFS